MNFSSAVPASIAAEDVARALTELQAIQSRLAQLIHEGRQLRRMQLTASVVQGALYSLGIVRRTAAHMPLGRWGALVVIVATTSVLSAACAISQTLDPRFIGLAAFAGSAFSVALATIALFRPSNSWCSLRMSQLAVDRRRINTELRKCNSLIVDLGAACTTAEHRYRLLYAALNSRRVQLLATDWRNLRGVAFETFLAEVLEELGYHVQMTKASGDQGVDLLATRDGSSIAIQAKGYAESVGNWAVQEAHAGKAFYGCTTCAVITNSAFTVSARTLAARIGCQLIDGAQLPDLINGRILL